MWHVIEDTIPASTTYENRRTNTIKVHGGILHTVLVTIPPGSMDLAHLQLRTGGYFILPRNEDKSIEGELVNVPFSEWFQLKSGYNNLTLVTWNDDDTYEHTVRVVIGILPQQAVEVEEEYIKTLREFMRLFRRRY